MNRIQFRHMLSAAATLMTLHFPGAALAQYTWIDERDVKQYSDMPPPASVPASRILKQPGNASKATSTLQELSDTKENSTFSIRTELSTAEKNAEFRKRKSEQAEKEKKAAEEAELAVDKAKNCERARNYHRVLEAGERVSYTDKNRERSYLTDEQRTQELRDARRMLEDCKS